MTPMLKPLVGLLFCLSWPVFARAESPEIAGPAVTPTGRLVRLEAQGDFDSCVWFAAPLDRADGIKVDDRHYVFTGPEGTYAIFLVTLKGTALGQAMGSFAIGPGPGPPPIPPPPGPGPDPEPDFPIGPPGVGAIVAPSPQLPPVSDANQWGFYQTRQLGRAYVTAVNRLANSIAAGKSMDEALAAFPADWLNARTYAFQDLKTFLNSIWPEGVPLTPDGRQRTVVELRKFANGLKGVK